MSSKPAAIPLVRKRALTGPRDQDVEEGGGGGGYASGGGSDGEADDNNTFEVFDAHVHEIRLVNNNMLRSLALHFYKEHYPAANVTQPTMPAQEARIAWCQDPRFVQRRQHADDAAAEADSLATIAAENVGEADQFGQLVDDHDEMPDIEAQLNYASMEDPNAYNPETEDNYKRHTTAANVKATVIVRYDDGKKYARVTGVWPTLSSSIALHIRGTFEKRTGTAVGEVSVNAMTRKCCIEMAPIETITGRRFYNILRESGCYELPVIRKYVTLLFSEQQSGVAQSNQGDGLHVPVPDARRGVVFESKQAAFRAQAQLRDMAVERATDDAVYSAAARTHLTIVELRRRLTSLDDSAVEKMFYRCPFISLGPLMVLRSAELCFIASVYSDVDGGVWREALAQGALFIDTLYSLLTSETDVLCFVELRKKAARLRGVPGLRRLPDISIEQYERLVAAFAERSNSVIVTAVTIHKRILLQDVHGEKKVFGAEFTASVPTSNGHMFTVFADHPDNRKPTYFHDEGEPETDKRRLRDQNPMTAAGRFCLLPKGDNSYTSDMRRWLGEDRARVGRLCTHDNFIAALHWLHEQQLIVTERFVGTGQHNKGMQVDAFYLAEVHEAQQRLVNALTDIYERGVAQSFYNQQAGISHNTLAPPRLIALQRVQSRQSECYNSLYNNAVKMMGKIVVVPKKQPKVKPVGDDADDDDDESDDGGSGEKAEVVDTDGMAEDAIDAVAPTPPILELAQMVAKDDAEWRKHYEKYLAEHNGGPLDAYADAKCSHPHRHLPLLRVANYSRTTKSGQPLGEEQIAALDAIGWSPIVQINGRGGVGKSALVATILDMFPPEQVLIVAPTGNVASDLTERTGHKAYTIHSVLKRHSQYMEAHTRTQAYRARSRRYTSNSGGVSALKRRAEEFTFEDVMQCIDEREARAYVDHMTGAYYPFVSPYAGKRVFIIDECSLAALGTLKSSIESFHAPRNGRAIYSLILVGDLDQLLPLGWGSPHSDVAHGMPMTISELVVNRRSRGTKLFDMAQAMAEHRYNLPMPRFGAENRAAAFRAIRDGDDIVALECTSHDLQKTIEKVMLELRAVTDDEMRRKVQFISTTNFTARQANDEVRMKIFGEDALLDFQDNFIATHQENPNGAVPGDLDAARKAKRLTIQRQLSMQVHVDDRIYLTKNSRVVFPAQTEDDVKREVHYNNSRRLRAVQFYDAPFRMHASMCRCQRCPAKPGDAPRNYRYPCMLRLDQVPPGRRVRDGFIKWHDQRLQEGKRRMGVFVDDNGNFVEMDVMRMLVPRSRYGNGFCLTTHRLQGSQADVVIYICVDDRWYINWKFIYTALTRGRERVIILSTQKVFNQLVRRCVPLRRSSLWQALLRNSTAVLNKYPQSLAAQAARKSHPRLFELSKLTTDEQWAIMEDARYRTDRVQQ